MELYLPEHAHGTFVVTVEAIDPVAEDYTTRSQQFTVTPVLDAPVLTVTHDPCICLTTLSFQINSSLVDTDGGERLQVIIAQLPEGTQLSAGQKTSSQEYTLDSFDILNVLTANFTRGNLNRILITVHANAIETVSGARATTSARISVPQCSTNPSAGMFNFDYSYFYLEVWTCFSRH